MTPGLRKFALTVHLAVSVGWIGAAVVYLVLGIFAVTSKDVPTIRAVWRAMELTGWYAIVPLAVGSLVTGLIMALGTTWGLFRHYWVVFSFVLTILATAVLISHMPDVSHRAGIARTAEGPELAALGGDLLHPGLGLVVLLLVAVLNVYKPRGLTPYGWRKLQKERAMRPASRVPLPDDAEPIPRPRGPY